MKLFQQTLPTFLLLAVLVAAPAMAAKKEKAPSISVDVTFSGNFGSTITDASGTYFNINYNSFLAYSYEQLLGIPDYDPYNGVQMWSTSYEPKVYIEEYQFGDSNYPFTTETTVEDVLNDPAAGVPLYFFGTEAQIMIAITNNGPANVQKVTVESEAFVLNTDGSNGESFGNAMTGDFKIGLNETVYIDASFTANIMPSENSGLDRLVIKVSRTNNGVANGNTDNALIGSFEAIFCPPEYEEALIDMAPAMP